MRGKEGKKIGTRIKVLKQKEKMTDSFYHSATNFLQAFKNTGKSKHVMIRSDLNTDIDTTKAPPTTSHEIAAMEPAMVVPQQDHKKSA